MSSFNYFTGIREDFSAMISEIGTSCTINVPTHTIDAFGNHVSTSYTSYTETLWVRQINEVMDVLGVGQLNREDISFIAPYNTNIIVESKITYNGRTYFVLSLDRPDESGNVTTVIGYAKRDVT